jgi:hypothetical protein
MLDDRHLLTYALIFPRSDGKAIDMQKPIVALVPRHIEFYPLSSSLSFITSPTLWKSSLARAEISACEWSETFETRIGIV